MVRVSFVEPGGACHDVEASACSTLMEAATRNGVPGIEGECGGACACATCHVYVPLEWQHLTGSASDNEREMLEMAVAPDSRSRLSCQIILGDALQGLVILTPPSQR